jgi:hypothetical protein
MIGMDEDEDEDARDNKDDAHARTTDMPGRWTHEDKYDRGRSTTMTNSTITTNYRHGKARRTANPKAHGRLSTHPHRCEQLLAGWTMGARTTTGQGRGGTTNYHGEQFLFGATGITEEGRRQQG